MVTIPGVNRSPHTLNRLSGGVGARETRHPDSFARRCPLMPLRWPARSRTPESCSPLSGRRHSRLRLERLEDRAVPSTFTVNTRLDVVDPADRKVSLREAITRANDHAGPDVIVLPAGVFKSTTPGAGEDGNATGDFDITDAVTIRGAGRGLTIIDGQQLDRVFDILGSAPSSIQVVFRGLT